MSQGWIRLWRQTFDNETLDKKPYCDLAAWFYLLSRVQHKKTAVNFGGRIWVLERGQLVTSIRHLAKQYGWGKKKVTLWLNHICTAKMTTIRGTPNGTVITVVKWDEYQPLGNYRTSRGDTKGDDKGDTEGTPRGHRGDRSNNTEQQNDRKHKGGADFSAEKSALPKRGRYSAKRISQKARDYAERKRKEREKKGGGK